MKSKHPKLLKGRAQRMGAVLTSVCLLGGGAAIVLGSTMNQAGADTVGPATFESGYTNGSVNGQNGWSSTGAYDQDVVDNSTIPGAPASFGTKSLRISDGVTTNSFGDQTFSPSTVNAGGEAGANAGPFSAGTLQPQWSGSFDFASTTPALEQVGSHMSVSPDRGDGSRMSYVRIEDSPLGFNLFFDEYIDAAPLAGPGHLNDGCGVEDGFTDDQIATNVSRSTPHNLKFEITFVPGPHNDIVKVLLDGTVIKTGTTWEDYYRDCAEQGGGDGGVTADQSRIVKDILFRESGTADPANTGKGILLDNVTVASGDVPVAPHPVAAVPMNKSAKVVWGAPASNGSPITSYTVTPYVGATATTPHVFNSANTTEVVTGLTNGTGYTFKITATNAFGTSVQSAATGVTVAGAPGKPGVPTATKASSGVLKVAFKAPGNNGASITRYTATCASTNGGTTKTGTKATSPVSVTGLTAGKSYRCTVNATNSRGTGPKSDASAAKVA